MDNIYDVVSNSSSTSIDTTASVAEIGAGNWYAEVLVDTLLMLIMAFGMGGNVMLFRTANYLIQKKKEAGRSYVLMKNRPHETKPQKVSTLPPSLNIIGLKILSIRKKF